MPTQNLKSLRKIAHSGCVDHLPPATDMVFPTGLSPCVMTQCWELLLNSDLSYFSFLGLYPPSSILILEHWALGNF